MVETLSKYHENEYFKNIFNENRPRPKRNIYQSYKNIHLSSLSAPFYKPNKTCSLKSRKKKSSTPNVNIKIMPDLWA